jgi:16S rRNA (cytosine967-C5)-methyltransferase
MPELIPPRQLAFLTLRAVFRGAYADVALERSLSGSPLETRDRRLVTELVYGAVRRQRTLDALVDQLAKKPSHHQPPDLRLILHLGFYQLRYLNQIPATAAVHSTVELAKQNGLSGLSGLVNGILRQYLRLAALADPLVLPLESIPKLGIQHSFPDWMVETWWAQVGEAETTQLCAWLNQSPAIDLRINPLQASREQVASSLATMGIRTMELAGLPQGLRLLDSPGSIQQLPGFTEGWWMVQDASAQRVGHFLDPQPGQVVMDACAAPGGKTTHLAELMQDQGRVWACDRTASRLRKLSQNQQRLKLSCIQTLTGDSCDLPQFIGQGDRVLVDAPCSGLGTLHRHADARWRQTPETVAELTQLQRSLLAQAATWVKPQGILVYATCTLNPTENEAVIQDFLSQHPEWEIQPPPLNLMPASAMTESGWVKVWPQRDHSDGFFMVRLGRRLMGSQ